MTEAIAESEFELPRMDGETVRAVVRPDDRRFALGLIAAIVLHAMFLVGFNSQPARHIGDPSGAADAVGVDFISEAALKRMSSVADSSAGQPAPQTSSTQPQPPQPAEPQAQPPAPQPVETEAAAAAPQPQPQAAEPVTPAPKAEDALEPAPQMKVEEKVEVVRPPREAPKLPAQAEQPKPRPPQKQPTRLSKLDLSLPPSVTSGPSGGGGMGLDRPAGITRSGENDAFARGVISALQRNMPQLRDSRGQVTVRITLDMNGDLVRTEIVRPSSVGDLDQSVVFSTRQASFPFPPRNARSADLIFLVTYIYR